MNMYSAKEIHARVGGKIRRLDVLISLEVGRLTRWVHDYQTRAALREIRRFLRSAGNYPTVSAMQHLAAEDPVEATFWKGQRCHFCQRPLAVHPLVLKPPVGGAKALRLDYRDIQRHRVHPGRGEGGRGSAGVGTVVENALSGHEWDRLKQALHRLPLSSRVTALVVGNTQHSSAIPPIPAHFQCEALQPFSLRAHLGGWVEHQVSDTVADVSLQLAESAGGSCLMSLALVDRSIELQAAGRIAQRTLQPSNELGAHRPRHYAINSPADATR
jgi:hypothetical protein